MQRANGQLLVIADSRRESRYGDLRRAVYSLLKHCGFPWRVHDLAAGVPDPEDFKCCAATVLAQEGVCASVDPSAMGALLQAVKEGAGLVILDPQIKSLPPSARRAIGILRPAEGELAGPIQASARPHFATHYQRGRQHTLAFAVRAGWCRPGDQAESLLLDGRGRTVCLGARVGRGRVFVLALSNEIWLPDRFGHGNGLSDVLWRGIVWAARKPFITLMCPPFVCARVDDACGDTAGGIAFSSPAAYPDWEGIPFFEYAAALAEKGFPAHISLYLDHVSAAAARRAAAAAEDNGAEFSPHAFSWSRGIYFWPCKGPLHDDLVRHYLEIVRCRFEQWGLKPAPVFAPHLGECGMNAAVELARAGRPYCNGIFVPDEKFGGEHLHWAPHPFGGYGIVYDTFPQDRGLRYVYSNPVLPEHLSFRSRDGCRWFKPDTKAMAPARDFLWNRWPDRAAGRSRASAAEAASAGARQVLHGLSNAFFGCLMTRESHIARFTRKDFAEVLSRIEGMLEGEQRIPAKLSEICEYIWNWKDCNLDAATVLPDGRAEFKISGRSDVKLKISVFLEKDDRIILRHADLPRFDTGYRGIIRTA